jgi:signal transduction histidine kinase
LKNKIGLLIAFSVLALIALSAIQAFLIRNTYELEEDAIIAEIDDLSSQIRSSQEIDSLTKVWQDSLTAIIAGYNNNGASKPALISRIKERANYINPSYRQYFNQKIQEAKLGYEIKYKSVLKSILIIEDDIIDTIYQTGADKPIKIFGDSFENPNALVVNTSILSSRARVLDSTGNDLPSKKVLKFDVVSEDMVLIEDQKNVLFRRMASLFIISIFIFLFVILLLFFSIKGLITQKKIAEIKTDFVNNITHEFKTPLATLGIAVKSLENKTILESPNFLNNTIEIIKRQNIRLQRLVDEVMNNSLSSKKIILYKEDVFDNEYFQQVIEDFELSSNISKTKIKKNLYTSEVVLKIDKFHFTTALRNIMENALKYGSEPSKIIFKTHLKQNEYTIEICNGGSKINKNDQTHIFEKFYRVNSGNLHKVRGMGLGLYYTKQIVEAHNGKIFVNSKESKVCLTIKIPLK